MAKKSKPRGMMFYSSYNFIDKDPVIDQVRTVVKSSGMSYKKINEQSNVSTGTLNNWFNGKTKRPQFCTVMAVVRSLGFDFAFRPLEGRATSRPKKPVILESFGSGSFRPAVAHSPNKD